MNLGLPEVMAEVDEGNTTSVAVVGGSASSPFDVIPGLL